MHVIHTREELCVFELLIEAKRPFDLALLLRFETVCRFAPFHVEDAKTEEQLFKQHKGMVAAFLTDKERMKRYFTVSCCMYLTFTRQRYAHPVPDVLVAGLCIHRIQNDGSDAATDWFYNTVYQPKGNYVVHEQVKRIIFAYACKVRAKGKNLVIVKSTHTLDCTNTSSWKQHEPWPRWHQAMEAFDSVIAFKQHLANGYCRVMVKAKETVKDGDFVFTHSIDSYRINMLKWLKETRSNNADFFYPVDSIRKQKHSLFACYFLHRLFVNEFEDVPFDCAYFCFTKNNEAAIDPMLTRIVTAYNPAADMARTREAREKRKSKKKKARIDIYEGLPAKMEQIEFDQFTLNEFANE